MPECSLSSDALPVRVCMVEDDDHIRKAVVDILEDEGFSVEVCPLGWHAQLCIRKNLPNAIILDVNMPDVDGIQLFYFLRGDQKTASIPVIFLTANPKKVAYELPNHEAMGAVLLPKPFRLQELLDTVQAAVAP